MPEYQPVDLTTPVGIINFPNLFVPRPVAQGGTPRYSMALLFDPKTMETPAYKMLRDEAIKCAQAAFGSGVNLQSIGMPFRPCSEKEQYSYMPAGSVFIQPWSKRRPKILTAQKLTVDIPDDIWAGQTGRCIVRAFSYNQSGKKGVNFGMGHIQMADMTKDRLDGRKSAEDSFDELTDYSSGGTTGSEGNGQADTAPRGADLPF